MFLLCFCSVFAQFSLLKFQSSVPCSATPPNSSVEPKFWNQKALHKLVGTYFSKIMAPTVILVEEKDVSAGVATSEQMSSANRGNRFHDGTTLPQEQQSKHDSVLTSKEKIQACGEEQMFVASSSRGFNGVVYEGG